MFQAILKHLSSLKKKMLTFQQCCKMESEVIDSWKQCLDYYKKVNSENIRKK